MSTQNKAVVTAAKKILKELGHDIPTGHLYELFAKLNGANSWNVAKAKGLTFAQVESAEQAKDVAALVKGQKVFSVKINTENERKCTKHYQISAESETDALAIMREYIDVRTGELTEKEVKREGTKLLLQAEEDSDFDYTNWEVVDSCQYAPDIEYATELSEEESAAALRSFLYWKKAKADLEADYKKRV